MFNNKKFVIIGILFLVILGMFFTHVGALSPYTWGCAVHHLPYHYNDGHYANVDFFLLSSLVKYFYEPGFINFKEVSATEWSFFCFILSVGLGITRSYALSTYTINILFLLALIIAVVNLLRKLNLSYKVIFISCLFILFVPFFNHYLGQSLHYLTSVSITFLVLICLIALNLKNERSGAIYGSLLGIITINYDWYIWYAAATCYFLFYYKLDSFKKYLVFSLVPCVLWMYCISSTGTAPEHFRTLSVLLHDVVPPWAHYFNNPAKDVIFPFIVSQVGLVVAFKMLTSYIYWPLLIFIGFYISDIKSTVKNHIFSKLIILIFLFNLFFILVLLPFEWENNPRRAIPLIFVFLSALIYSINKAWSSKNPRIKKTVLALLILSFILSFSDTFFQNPTVPVMEMGETIRTPPKFLLDINKLRLNVQSIPNLPVNGPLKMSLYPKATMNKEYIPKYVLSQLIFSGCLYLLFRFLVSLELLPKYTQFIYLIIYIFSLMKRFL